MNTKSKFLATVGLITLGLSATAAIDDAQAAKEGFEKCYGIAKAGKNDCGAKDGSHACAGYAKTDYSMNEWKYVPEGTCADLQKKHSHDEGHSGDHH